MNPLVPGFGLIFFSAISGGAFALPLRLRRRFEVENTMLVAFGFATIIIPLIMAQILIPGWPEAISSVGKSTILLVMALGFGWGMGGVFMALGINSIGMSITYATVMGLNTVVGSIIPMTRKWELIPGEAKIWTFIGIGICIIGIFFCGWAGFKREWKRDSNEDILESRKKVSIFLLGFLSCIASGFLSACANIGFDRAEPVVNVMAEMGADPRFATLCGWLPMYWGGYLAMVIVFGSTIIKRRTLINYTGTGAGHDLLLAIVMGLLHFLAQIPYGMGAWYIGPELGKTVGWAVCIASSLFVANMLGFLTGEWKEASKKSKNMVYFGLSVLMIAIVCMAYANSKI